MRTLTELNTLILGWAAERHILKNSTPFAQAKKTAEEVMELIQADKWYHVAMLEESKRLAKLDVVTNEPEDGEDVQFALMDIKDAIGDIYVTLVVGLGCCDDHSALYDKKTMVSVSSSRWASCGNAIRHLTTELMPLFYCRAITHEPGGWVYPSTIIEIMGLLACVALSYDLRLEECVEAAYEQIKDRKGYLREDGVFVKETT